MSVWTRVSWNLVTLPCWRHASLLHLASLLRAAEAEHTV